MTETTQTPDPEVRTPEDDPGPPADPGRSDEARDPDREGGVGPPDKPDTKPVEPTEPGAFPR